MAVPGWTSEGVEEIATNDSMEVAMGKWLLLTASSTSGNGSSLAVPGWTSEGMEEITLMTLQKWPWVSDYY